MAISSSITMYLGNNQGEGSLSFFIEGGWNQPNANLELVMAKTHCNHTYQMDLFIQASPSSTNSFLPLYINNDGTAIADAMLLYLSNLGVGNGTTLYIEGQGLYDGYYIGGGTMPLILERTGVLAGVQPMFLKADDSGPNSYMPLYLCSAPYGVLTLVMPNVDYLWSSSPNAYLNLYLESGKLESELKLYIQNTLAAHNNLDLVVCQLWGEPNSYLDLVLWNSEEDINAYITLFLCSTLVNSELQLSIHGY